MRVRVIMLKRKPYDDEEPNAGSRREKWGRSFQTCKKAGLFAFIISAFFALSLMVGCTAEAENTGSSESDSGQTQSTASADNVDSSGYKFEDSALVEVKIEEEGR